MLERTPMSLSSFETPDSNAGRKFASYFCAGSNPQRGFGLTLEAQQAAVSGFLKRHRGELIKTFTEQPRGCLKRRPELEEALTVCKAERANLLVASLGPTFRNLAFFITIAGSGVACTAVDRPDTLNINPEFKALFAEFWR
jgi:hypothetical protein